MTAFEVGDVVVYARAGKCRFEVESARSQLAFSWGQPRQYLRLRQLDGKGAGRRRRSVSYVLRMADPAPASKGERTTN